MSAECMLEGGWRNLGGGRHVFARFEARIKFFRLDIDAVSERLIFPDHILWENRNGVFVQHGLRQIHSAIGDYSDFGHGASGGESDQ